MVCRSWKTMDAMSVCSTGDVARRDEVRRLKKSRWPWTKQTRKTKRSIAYIRHTVVCQYVVWRFDALVVTKILFSCFRGLFCGRCYRAGGEDGFYLCEDFLTQLGIFFQESSSGIVATTEFFLPVTIRRAGFGNHAGLFTQSDDFTLRTDTFVVHNIKLGLAKWRGHLVFHHFGARATAHHFIAFLNLVRTSDVDAHAGVKLQGLTTGRGFRIAEHHADLHTNLIDENNHSFTFSHNGCQLAQSLAHQSCLLTHM